MASRAAAEEPDLICLRLSNKKEIEIYLSQEAVTEGAFICQEILVGNEYLCHGIELTKGATVIDVGANIGVFGIQALTAVGPAGGDINYIGVEPCPPTFRALQLNLLGEDGRGSAGSFFHLNPEWQPSPLAAEAAADGHRVCPPYPANIRLVAKAVSSSCGTLPFTFYPRLPGNSTLRPAEKQRLQAAAMPDLLQHEVQLQVPVITLDQLLEDERVTGPIDLLKVDVEGEELAVLQGLSGPNWARVRQVVAEVHDCLPGDNALPTSTTQPAPDSAAAAAFAAAIAAAAAGDMQHMQQLASSAEGASLGFPKLPGPRGAGIDGHWIRFASGGSGDDDGGSGTRPSDQQEGTTARPLSTAPAAASPSGSPPLAAERRPPPPRDGGRVMAIAQMLKELGFLVVISCPLGLPINYMIHARRPAASS